MTRIDGLTLTQAEHAIEAAHPGWHLWHDENGEHATNPEATYADLGLPLDAPSVETIEPVIGQWEWQHPGASLVPGPAVTL